LGRVAAHLAAAVVCLTAGLAAEVVAGLAAVLVAGLAGVWALAATVLAAKRRIKIEDFMAWSNSE